MTTIAFLNNFSEDLTPPDINAEYRLLSFNNHEYITTGWTLFHKLLCFPNLLKDNIEIVKQDINTSLTYTINQTNASSFDIISMYFDNYLEDEDLLELLVQNGLQINLRFIDINKIKMSLLNSFINSCQDVNEFLIQYNHNGNRYIVNNGFLNIDVIKLLINKGADINYIDKNGKTSFVYASNRQNGIQNNTNYVLSKKKYLLELIDLGAKLIISEDLSFNNIDTFIFLNNKRYEQLENKMYELHEKSMKLKHMNFGSIVENQIGKYF